MKHRVGALIIYFVWCFMKYLVRTTIWSWFFNHFSWRKINGYKLSSPSLSTAFVPSETESPMTVSKGGQTQPPNEAALSAESAVHFPKDRTINNNTSLGFTVNPGIQPAGEMKPPAGAFMGYMDTSPWTVLDHAEDHPGMRKSSGFLQPIRHLSGEATLLKYLGYLDVSRGT